VEQFGVAIGDRLHYRVVHTEPVVSATPSLVVLSDERIELTGKHTQKSYDWPLRRIEFYIVEQARYITLLTNHFGLPARHIAELYKSRWQVELFFKWIKQNLRIKAFVGTSANAVKTQIWCAVCTYVLVAIVKKRLAVDASMHSILQVLSLSLFEVKPLDELLGTLAQTDDLVPSALVLPFPRNLRTVVNLTPIFHRNPGTSNSDFPVAWAGRKKAAGVTRRLLFSDSRSPRLPARSEGVANAQSVEVAVGLGVGSLAAFCAHTSVDRGALGQAVRGSNAKAAVAFTALGL
jgi:hypothetical protein